MTTLVDPRDRTACGSHCLAEWRMAEKKRVTDTRVQKGGDEGSRPARRERTLGDTCGDVSVLFGLLLLVSARTGALVRPTQAPGSGVAKTRP